jgi:hypothetical protein
MNSRQKKSLHCRLPFRISDCASSLFLRAKSNPQSTIRNPQSIALTHICAKKIDELACPEKIFARLAVELSYLTVLMTETS